MSGGLYATVTVDWEGVFIDDESLNMVASFKAQFPEIPLTHFICPAYFTRGQDLSQSIRKIHAVTEGDEIGIHMHCWESLVAESGVTPILRPVCHPFAPTVPYGEKKFDDGFAVPFGVYTVSQIRQILRTAKWILGKNGLTSADTCVSFRCGAGLASDAVFLALQNEGFTHDASAIPAHAMAAESIERALPTLTTWIRSLWGVREIHTPTYLANSISHRAYPEGIQSCFTLCEYAISQPRVLNNDIVEVPATGSMIDYVSPRALYQYIQQAWALSQHQDTYMSFGFHLESATAITEFSDGMPLLHALMHVLSLARQDGITMTYLRAQEVKGKT